MARFMASLRSLLNSLFNLIGTARSQDYDDAAPSRVAIMSGGVITISLVVMLLVI